MIFQFPTLLEDDLSSLTALIQARNYRRGGGRSPLPFFENWNKSVLIWRKNALTVVIYGYNFLFKMRFLRVSRGKTTKFLACGAFLSRVVGECLSKCPNSKKTPMP